MTNYQNIELKNKDFQDEQDKEYLNSQLNNSDYNDIH